MRQEDVFLQGLIENPADDMLRLVYSDWLEEQGDQASMAKTEYLRLTVQSAADGASQDRLQQIAAGLDAEWLAPTSRLAIENCPVDRAHARRSLLARLFFRKRCSRRWEHLGPTADHAVRYCEDCQRNVYHCPTSEDARIHAAFGDCIAVNLGVLRRKGDLDGAEVWFGEPDSSMFSR